VITTQQDLAEELAMLYESIKAPINKGNPTGLVDDLDYRCQWLARSAELVADAQWYVDQAQGHAADGIETGTPWSLAKILIESKTADESRLLKLAERLNATLTHQIDSIRSVLSFEKQLANQDRYQGTKQA